MAQKLSIDPDIVDGEILRNSLNKIDQGFQNLIEIKKMENPVIYLNNSIADKLTKNILKLKILLNNKISESEEYKKLSNTSNKVEIYLTELFNSPEKIFKFRANELEKIEFDIFSSKLNKKFSSSFLDFILVNKKINSGFKEIDQYLSDYLENKSKTIREFKLKKDLKNFNDFQINILNKMGFDGNTKNQSLYLINPGILTKINTSNKNYLDLLVTIKSICLYFSKKINEYKFRPKIIIITDNANFVGKDNNNLRKKFLREFEDLEKLINVDFFILDRWEKKSISEQRFIYSSNEVGYSLNIELDFLAKGTYGTKEIDFKNLKNLIFAFIIFSKNHFLQLKIAKNGLIKEILNPINRAFLEEKVINKIKNNQDSLKNPAFREIFNKLNIN